MGFEYIALLRWCSVYLLGKLAPPKCDEDERVYSITMSSLNRYCNSKPYGKIPTRPWDDVRALHTQIVAAATYWSRIFVVVGPNEEKCVRKWKWAPEIRRECARRSWWQLCTRRHAARVNGMSLGVISGSPQGCRKRRPLALPIRYIAPQPHGMMLANLMTSKHLAAMRAACAESYIECRWRILFNSIRPISWGSQKGKYKRDGIQCRRSYAMNAKTALGYCSKRRSDKV